MTPFTVTGRPHWHQMVALVSLTVVAAAVYTAAHCPDCDRWLYLAPGNVTIVAHRIQRAAEGTGMGRVVGCKRCGTLCEIVEHR